MSHLQWRGAVRGRRHHQRRPADGYEFFLEAKLAVDMWDRRHAGPDLSLSITCRTARMERARGTSGPCPECSGNPPGRGLSDTARIIGDTLTHGQSEFSSDEPLFCHILRMPGDCHLRWVREAKPHKRKATSVTGPRHHPPLLSFRNSRTSRSSFGWTS